MLHSFFFLLSLSSAPLAAEPVSAPTSTSATAQQADPEYEKRRKEAGDDVAKLWSLYEWCTASKKQKEGRTTLRKILAVDPNHKAANEALGMIEYDGKWFPSQKKVDEYKKAQGEKATKDLEKQAKEKGLVVYKGELVDPKDVPFLEKGLVRDEAGNWVDPVEQQKIKEGWTKQDLEWVSPADKEKQDKGLWKCGEEWLTLDEANKYHSEIGQWWRIPASRFPFVLYTTCDRALATGPIMKHLDGAFDDMTKVYGFEPKTRATVLVLRNQDQYGKFAGGDEDAGRGPSETHGLSSIHYAYLADIAFEPGTGVAAWGVSFWDSSTPEGNNWGIHHVRHAMGIAFAHEVDPSKQAYADLNEIVAKGSMPDRDDMDGFVKDAADERIVPAWFRYGGAVYAERYFMDTLVGPGGNSHWARDWSVQTLVAKGGLRPLPKLFELEPSNDPDDPASGIDAAKWFNEIGLVIAFIVDGQNPPVVEKHKAMQQVLQTGDAKAIAAAAKALADEVAKHDAELRKFGGI